MRLLLLGIVSIVCVAAWPGVVVADATGEAASAEQVKSWVAQLNDEGFGVRERAMQRLLDAGRPAVGPLAAMVPRGGPDSRLRAFMILHRLSMSEDAETAHAAFRALSKLAVSKDARIASRASRSLVNYQQRRRNRAIQAIQRYGGQISIDSGKITRVEIRAGWKGGDDGLRHLRVLTDIPWLSLEDSSVTDAGLVHLAGLKKLRYLYLGGSKVQGSGLVHIKALTDIYHLSLRYLPVEDRWLRHVGEMTHVESLGLDDTQVTDDSLRLLANMTNLKVLWLDRSKVTGAGLAYLKPFKKLERLDLDRLKIEAIHLAHLKELPNLTNLYLGGTPLSNDAIPQLAELKSLRELDVRDTLITKVKQLVEALPNANVSVGASEKEG